MPRPRLSLRPYTAPLSCSLQLLLKLSLLSLRQSLLQFVLIVSLLLNHRNPIFEPVWVSFMLTEVRDCDLLIVVTSSTFLKIKDMLKEKSS